MKVLILVMSCNVEPYPILVQKQRETWDSINHPNTETIYYYAGQTTELIGDRLILDTKEGQGYFYIKTMLAFKFLLKLDWDYIFKTDNSSYINKDVLVDLLKHKSKRKYYGGHLYQTNYNKSDPFLWGEGIALSRDVVKMLVNDYDNSTVMRSGVEDVHMGIVLHEQFNWDTSLTIQSYWSNYPVTQSHAYRCKNDAAPTSLQDQLTAMENLHMMFYPTIQYN